jgi:hypothetical protein
MKYYCTIKGYIVIDGGSKLLALGFFLFRPFEYFYSPGYRGKNKSHSCRSGTLAFKIFVVGQRQILDLVS